MDKFTKRSTINSFFLMSLLFLSILFTSENAFSRQNWNGDYTKVTYDSTENSISFKFEFFDYHFGPGNESGYLRWCDFFYTTDNVNYTHLMRAETDDQDYHTVPKDSWTWLKMRYKRTGAQIKFIGCFFPLEGYMWSDNGQDVEVDVYSGVKAFFTVKWFLGDEYKNVKRIRLNGFWKVNGAYKGDNINNVYYDIPTKDIVTSKEDLSVNDQVKITAEDDGILITGVDFGETIKVFNASGVEVKSMVTNSADVNIKLAKNQIYVVNIGKEMYKVAL